jgi:hypothetical protein
MTEIPKTKLCDIGNTAIFATPAKAEVTVPSSFGH